MKTQNIIDLLVAIVLIMFIASFIPIAAMLWKWALTYLTTCG